MILYMIYHLVAILISILVIVLPPIYNNNETLSQLEIYLISIFGGLITFFTLLLFGNFLILNQPLYLMKDRIIFYKNNIGIIRWNKKELKKKNIKEIKNKGKDINIDIIDFNGDHHYIKENSFYNKDEPRKSLEKWLEN